MTDPTGTAPETADQPSGRDSLGRDPAPWLAPARLAIGLLQGAALWWLHRSAEAFGWLCDDVRPGACPTAIWPATEPLVFGPLVLVFAFLPLVLLAGVGRMRPVTLAIWTTVAGVALALLALHDVARQGADTVQGLPFRSPAVVLFSAAALFIAHHLVAPADLERRRIASFPAYFDTTWKAGVQLAMSLGFTAAFWLLLQLGAALFKVIGLDFLELLLREHWFWIPVSTLAFSIAVHLTDVRDGLIRGVRTVVLMLLSWLLLVMTVLAAGFLAALPFTGLEGLWETGNGTSLVLVAAAALIILINTAYQDGRPDNLPPLILRIAVRVASVLISPLIIIAVWGLSLRIGQYGLTPDRIIAAACTLVGAAYAVGYGWAALSPFWRKGDWMRPLERTNIWTAILSLVVILLLFSPALDPARLSVMDQVSRLESGAVAPGKFDYRFLRFESGKAGQTALARLTRSDNLDIAARAKAIQDAERYPFESIEPEPPVTAADIRIRPNPAGAALPGSFTQQYGRLTQILSGCREESVCEARMVDLDKDGSVEILVAARLEVSVFKREADGRWFEWAEYLPSTCDESATDAAAALRGGQFETAPPVFPDLLVNGVRLRRVEGELECAPPPDPVKPTVGVEPHGRLRPVASDLR